MSPVHSQRSKPHSLERSWPLVTTRSGSIPSLQLHHVTWVKDPEATVHGIATSIGALDGLPAFTFIRALSLLPEPCTGMSDDSKLFQDRQNLGLNATGHMDVAF